MKRLEMVDVRTRLRKIATLSENLGKDMGTHMETSGAMKHGKELIGAAQIMRQWADKLESNNKQTD